MHSQREPKSVLVPRPTSFFLGSRGSRIPKRNTARLLSLTDIPSGTQTTLYFPPHLHLNLHLQYLPIIIKYPSITLNLNFLICIPGGLTFWRDWYQVYIGSRFGNKPQFKLRPQFIFYKPQFTTSFFDRLRHGTECLSTASRCIHCVVSTAEVLQITYFLRNSPEHISRVTKKRDWRFAPLGQFIQWPDAQQIPCAGYAPCPGTSHGLLWYSPWNSLRLQFTTTSNACEL